MNRTNTALQDNKTSVLQPSSGVLQRKCACGNKTIAAGECTECAQQKHKLQRKITIGASNDPLEKEADRVADQVMRMPVNSSIGNAPLHIQRYTEQLSGQSDTIAPASVDRVLASSGNPMEPTLRQDMEQRFGHDFSRVRVYSGAVAEQSARDVNAHAYTVGHSVVFGAGQLSPTTDQGKQLIAHELTHVLQQAQQSKRLQKKNELAHRADPCNYAGEAVKNREIHLNIGMSAARVYTNSGSHEQFDNLITGPSTRTLARNNGWCHMYSIKGHQKVSSHGLINFVNYCGGFGFHSNFWKKKGNIERIPGSQSAGCARLNDPDASSTTSSHSKRFYDLVRDLDCVRIYSQPFWRQPTFKRCPSSDESCST